MQWYAEADCKAIGGINQQHLKASGVTRLNMTDADRLTLQGLIEMRLGNAALQMAQHRLTTYKNESSTDHSLHPFQRM